MARVCDITGKHLLFGNNVSKANNKTRRKFHPNLVDKKLYLEEQGVWLKLRLATSTLRTINKNGLASVLQAAYKKGTLNPALRPVVELLPQLSLKTTPRAEQV